MLDEFRKLLARGDGTGSAYVFDSQVIMPIAPDHSKKRGEGGKSRKSRRNQEALGEFGRICDSQLKVVVLSPLACGHLKAFAYFQVPSNDQQEYLIIQP